MNKYPPERTSDSGRFPWLRPAQLRGLRLVALLGAVALAGAALLFSVVWAKEGFGREDLPRCAIGLLILLGAQLSWWLLCRRVAPPAAAPVLGAGIGVLLLPSLIYAAFGVRTVANTLRGNWLSRRASVRSYREAAIVWHDFDGPVGLALELDLDVPARLQGSLLPPRLAYADSSGFSADDYFSSPFYQLEGRQLTQPVFQAIDPVVERSRLARGTPVHLSYRLYPGYVRRLDPGLRVCIDTAAVERASRDLESQSTRSLAASWLFAGPGGLTVDLSPTLTKELRTQSRWATTRAGWDSLLRRLTPPFLTAAGYVVCKPEAKVWAGEQCWCAPPQR
jgi:hypothetical protein